jgi:hypothetical protein
MIAASSAAAIELKSLELISQFIFQNSNTIQEAFASLAITLTPNKLKQFKKIFLKILKPEDMGYATGDRGLLLLM